ncbi:HTH Psq-type DNA-binding domain-containing protein [Penicillium ucsense]|uniref:HTH Psq-type DNA-binding domain-containing protein n=1 Tax=Penicillium ucsense TaxID=2839758 RepID=A0A8J8VWF3_9EURO|nr:HTH Psq-type DNA-binding domain-containing protein [Penicillium ucsense]KAF7730488.1 HTH Psq-type DNA-binding domain-containing protein [Penicillium ucsense]
MDDSTTAMETDPSPDNDFAHSPWVELNSFASPHSSPPLPEYTGFDFSTSSLMAVDPTYGMSIPPPYASMPLPMPSHAWPSMLTHQAAFAEVGLPAVSVPTSVSPSAPVPPIRKTSTGGATPRRTLTDEDRRQMCLYHEENKQAKQTDIGALFGVERSTVSKVLRQKEKYLNPDDGNRSPIKRAKGRVPDIEKALSNWARNYQRQGFPLSDEMIREKARFFASTCGCPESKEKVLTASWLERFKQKNSLVGAKSRRGSTDRKGVRSSSNSPIRINTGSATDSTIQSPGARSPISSHGFGSPLSPTHSHDGLKLGANDELPELTGGVQRLYSKTTTMLDTTSCSVMTSPTSTLVSESPFTPTNQYRLLSSSLANRPRSQTLPTVPIDPSLLAADESQSKSDLMKDVTILESPLEFDDHESQAAIRGIDPSKMMRRNHSDSEIKTDFKQRSQSFSKSTNVSPTTTNATAPVPDSPTQGEARQALELVMNYFQRQPAGLAAQEYITIGKLMERLELANHQQNAVLGGLARIDEHGDAPRVAKKRSIQNIG